MKLIYEKSQPGRRAGRLPVHGLPVPEVPDELRRAEPPRLPELAEPDLMRHFTELSSLLAKHKTGADYQSYTALTDADIKELTVSLDALSEQVSKVPGVVEAT